MMNGIVALHRRQCGRMLRKEWNAARSAGCVGSHIRSSLFTRSFKHFVAARCSIVASGWLVVSDPVENASFMPRVLASSYSFSNSTLLHSWTSLLNILTLPCCVLGTFSIRSGLLAPKIFMAVLPSNYRHIYDSFYQMKQEASVRRTYKKRWLWRSTLVHLRHSAHATRPVMLCYGRI
ncbi:hypothetical protein ZWY2020_026098 [Hordeum vulgare]|nr:hypothetical protein ZWY2020_026098 [Hordeum vulgare]